jgi:hypothetical protein
MNDDVFDLLSNADGRWRVHVRPHEQAAARELVSLGYATMEAPDTLWLTDAGREALEMELVP